MSTRNTLGEELKRMAAFEYKTVDTSTLKGLKQAERLKASGWKVIRVGLFSVQFERETVSKQRRVLGT